MLKTKTKTRGTGDFVNGYFWMLGCEKVYLKLFSEDLGDDLTLPC